MGSNRKYVLRVLLGVFLALIALYTLFQTRDLLFGAHLAVTTIYDGQIASDSLLAIEGRMRHARQVNINGNEVKTDPDGYFTESILLSPGYNLVTVSAYDRFGKIVEKTYRVIYTPLDTLEATKTPEEIQDIDLF
ncbi:MAG: hypothetical protein MUD00_01285 [Candidatus Pacebacteria bacterium]|jgi:hypothetical protein|nr:hypothetical protein [Candidatus Paceibacterota bacterium]